MLSTLTVACGPQAAAPSTTPTVDAFAVVRATSQAAFREGSDRVARGDIVVGCTLIDTAVTNDPDTRPELQAALEQCKVALSALLAAQVTPTAIPAAAQRTIVVPTVPAAATAAPKPNAAASPAAAASPVAAASTTTQAGQLQTWNDPQARFSIGAPADWKAADQPQALFGTPAVEFRDASGRASLGVAVDSNGRAVSPELYAAGMEIAMGQQVPGYALENVVPGSTAGQPSVRRTFTFTQKDASGREMNARAFQVTVLKGQTPYIITASAPADQFPQFSDAFDQMVESFRFT